MRLSALFDKSERLVFTRASQRQPHFVRSLAFALCVLSLLSACGNSGLPNSASVPLQNENVATAPAKWVTSWGAANSAAFPISYNQDSATLMNTAGTERTLRLMARTTLGGSALRVRLTNLLGMTPLTVGALRVALRDQGAAVRPASSLPVTFGGAANISIPAGGQIVSDAVWLPTTAGVDIAVSMYLPGAALTPSIHAQAFQTNYLTANGAGDTTADDSGAAFTELNSSFPVLEGIDVLTSNDAGAIVVLGDSLSDGVGSTFDSHDRWPDQLAQRLQAAGIDKSIVNEGLTGNSIDCAVHLPQDGPNGAARLDSDVLSKAGISAVFVFEGTNDLANFCSAAQLQAAITSLVSRIHAKGLPVIGATLIPRVDIHFSPQAIADRLVVNNWIRRSHVYDHVVDFDAAVRASDGGWDPQYDSGDQVHLNPAGYRKLAEAVDLSLLSALK